MSQAKSNAKIRYSPFIRVVENYLRSRRITRALAPLALLLVLHSLQVSTRAQDTTTPDSEEITRLKDKKTRVELERDIEVAEKEKRDAQFPKPSTSPLSGETKINAEAIIESDMVSYYSMAQAANNIVRALRDSNVPIRNLAIYSKADADLLLNYRVTSSQIDVMRKQYCHLLKQAPDCPSPREIRGVGTKMIGPAIQIIGSLLGSFVDMAALLRTNVTVQGHTFDIGESALVSEVFRAIRSNGGLNGRPALYYPSAFPPQIRPNTTSEILGKLEVLFNLKARVSGVMKGLEDNAKKIKKTSGKIEETEATIKGIKREQQKSEDELRALVQTQNVYGRRTPFAAHQRIQELRKHVGDLNRDLYRTQIDLDSQKAALNSQENEQRLYMSRLGSDLQAADVDETIVRLKLLNERLDQFVATLTKIDGATGVNPLTAYIKAENLSQVLHNSGAGEQAGGNGGYWLQLAVVKAGGNNRIKTNLVTDIFTGGSRVSHSGGVIVQYNLYSLNGESLVSDTLTEYAGYIKSGKIKRLPNPTAVDEVVDENKDNQAKRKSGSRETKVARAQL